MAASAVPEVLEVPAETTTAEYRELWAEPVVPAASVATEVLPGLEPAVPVASVGGEATAATGDPAAPPPSVPAGAAVAGATAATVATAALVTPGALADPAGSVHLEVRAVGVPPASAQPAATVVEALTATTADRAFAQAQYPPRAVLGGWCRTGLLG
ncbi:hypothetical protein DE4576_05452 [Mycobacterium marinum]|nr:hypothetical protein DE4576_05452 [Mycobacterium marinum]